jgi:hypothetical protein
MPNQVLEQDRAPLLFSLVFGEGVVNDATTVALLRTVQVLLRLHANLFAPSEAPQAAPAPACTDNAGEAACETCAG